MKKIVEKMARSVEGYNENPSPRVVNEVVVRAVLRALLRGMSPTYELRVRNGLDGAKYSYKIDVPGTAIDIKSMHEACAVIALERTVSTPMGLECLCRYLFAICAFMPENVVGLVRSLGQSSVATDKLKDALSSVTKFVDEIHRLRDEGKVAKEINWSHAYSLCLKKILPPLLKLHSKELASVAFYVYTCQAAKEIDDRRAALVQSLTSGDAISGGAGAIVQKLNFLANFNPCIASHFKVLRSIDPRKPSATLAVRGQNEIVKALSRNEGWAHVVQSTVHEYVRQYAHINAEQILLVSMLLDKCIGITEDNVEALVLDNEGVAYSFSRKFSFPILGDKKFHSSLDGRILSTKEGEDLVNLLIESHHTRNKCFFGVSYKQLASEVKKVSSYFNISLADKSDSVFSHVVSYVHDAVLGSNAKFNTEVAESAKDLASFLAERMSFLQEFVDSSDYPLLAEFLEQSNSMDTYRDFARFLEDRRACEREKEKVAERSLAKRKALQCARALGTIVGLSLMASGMLSVCYAVYVRHSALQDLLPAGMRSLGLGANEMLVAGFVVFTLGFVVTSMSWLSAKGAASSFRKLKDACAVGNSIEKSGSLGESLEYHLRIPDGTDINTVGFVGMCSMSDFGALCENAATDTMGSGSAKSRKLTGDGGDTAKKSRGGTKCGLKSLMASSPQEGNTGKKHGVALRC